jgi:hypothetical protein
MTECVQINRRSTDGEKFTKHRKTSHSLQIKQMQINPSETTVPFQITKDFFKKSTKAPQVSLWSS